MKLFTRLKMNGQKIEDSPSIVNKISQADYDALPQAERDANVYVADNTVYAYGEKIGIADGMVTESVTLLASAWVDNEQTVSVSTARAEGKLVISNAPSGITCIASNNGSLTFACEGLPAVDINVDVAIFDKGGGAIETVIDSISVNGENIAPDGAKNVDIPVPTKTSDLQNDSNFIKDSAIPIKSISRNNTALTPDSNRKVNIVVPTKTSELTNDSNFIKVNGTSGSTFNLAVASPVGEIIAFMGASAPAYFLACDGTVYNISAYKALADFIKAQFGSYSKFGGNGSTTFAVPDLRGEFLRGWGTNAHANQGSGSAVGTHQDGTVHRNVNVDSSGNLWAPTVNSGTYDAGETLNKDKDLSFGAAGSLGWLTVSNNKSGSSSTFYTSRPTNTSVLYCIRYAPTYALVYA